MKKIIKGDRVYVITGKDKGKTGNVLQVLDGGKRVLVQGINIVKKHVKQNPNTQEVGGIKDMEVPLQASKVLVFDPNVNKPSRVGFKKLEDGQRVRIYKASGQLIEVKK